MVNKLIHKIKNFKYKKKVVTKRKSLYIDNIEKTNFKRRKKRSLFKFVNKINFNFTKRNLASFYILLLIILICGVIVLLIGPFLRVKNINIIKTDSITNIDIAYRSVENLRWNHILFLNNDAIKESFKNYQENIKDVDISLKLFDSIDIKLWSYKPVFETKINNKNYIITENGALISSKENKNITNINIFNNIKNIDLIPDYKIVFNEKYIKAIKEIEEKLKNNLVTINIKNLDYYNVERELMVILNNDNILIFDLNWDIKHQIEKLVIYNKEHIDINKKKIVYIDLRIKNKVFSCPITKEYQCKLNLKKIYSLKSL